MPRDGVAERVRPMHPTRSLLKLVLPVAALAAAALPAGADASISCTKGVGNDLEI